MKSCCGDGKIPKSDAAVEVFDPAAPTVCCAPSATTSNASTTESKSSCCSTKDLDVGSAPYTVEGTDCCSVAASTSETSCAVAAPPSALYSLSEPSKPAATVDNNLFTDVSCPPSASDSSKAAIENVSSTNAGEGTRVSSFRIGQMCCPYEQTMIEGKLAKMSGIQKLEFNMMNRTMAVWHELPNTSSIEAAVLSLGMQAEPLTANANATRTDTPEVLPLAGSHKNTWWPLALSGVAAVGAEVLHFTNSAPEWVVAVIALFAIVLCGPTTYKKGLISIKHLNLNINALMSIAVTGAVLIGQWPEAAMVMFLFTIAEMVEAKSLDRVRNAIKGADGFDPGASDRAPVQR